MITKIDHFLIRIQLILIGCLLGISTLRAQAPVVDFSANVTSGCGPLSVQFKDLSTNKPVSWAWDFGNGSISTAQNPIGVYGNPGTYTVTLIAKNADGASSIIKTDLITVYPYPTVKFISNLQVACAPSTIYFTDQSTPGQGALVSWSWGFGDGATSSDQNPGHVYASTGYYSVSLKITNSGGCSSSATVSRYIRVVPGVKPDFGWSQSSSSCSAPFDINFINQTSGPGNLTYQWDLDGDGTIDATTRNPSTTYPTNNSYNVGLTVKSDFGCAASVSKAISFQGTAPVITAPDNACLNTPVTFQNSSTPTPVSSSWNFGDGTTSTQTNPEKTYTNPGTYTVTLVNKNAFCTSTATKTINVSSTVPGNFTSDKTGGCKAPTDIAFQDQTSGGSAWHWDFGDGQTSGEQNPKHTYTTAGTFDVKLNVTTATGCAVALTKESFIRIAPPDFTINAFSTQGCVGTPGGISPTATIDAPDGVKSYQWTAQGATPSSSTVSNPHFEYTTQGNYDLALQITTTDGCVFSKNTPGIVIVGTKTTPDFTAPVTVSCARTPLVFNSSSAPVDTWRWSFGDGTASATSTSVTHSYADTGYQDVTLTVVNHGCAQSLTKQKYIYIRPPLAGFKYTIDCTNRTHVTFTDTTQYDPTKPAPTYQWDFGDGTTSTAANPPPHDYTLPLKTWTVILTVTQAGCTDQVKIPIDLQPITPAFSVTPAAVCKNTPFTLNYTGTSLTSIDSFQYTVNTVKRSLTNPSFSTDIPDTGFHTLQLTVIDKGGCPFKAPDQQVQITGPTAKVDFSGGCRNSPITLNDISAPYRSDAIQTWYVDFGDGKKQSFNSKPLNHVYSDTGTYDILLAVQDAKSCVDTFRLSAAVRVTGVKAGFYAADTIYCPEAPVPFIDSSKGSNLTYSWDFGDGTPVPASTVADPTHPYPKDNDRHYTVKLRVTDDAGCADSITYNNYMHIVKPVAAFTLQDSVGICVPLEANFIPAGKYYDSLYWDFGDGTTSNLDTTAHFYNGYGPPPSYAYKTMLILQGAGGCRDTASRNVLVFNPNPTSTLTFTPTRECDSVAATFTLTPTPYTSFTLFFGDGAADSSGNTTVKHTFTKLGAYAPQLSMSDGSGCIVGRNNGAVTVLGAVPIYTTDKKALCDTGTVFFQGVIVSNDGQASLKWDFGDGDIQTGIPTGHPDDPFLAKRKFYSAPAVRLASLTISTNSGCNETYTDTINIWQTPHPVITTEGDLCDGLIQFHGNTTVPNPDSVSYAWTLDRGPTSSSKDPKIDLASGFVTAHLKTSVQFGCNDTISKTILVNPLPEIKGPKEIVTPVGIPVTLPLAYSSNVTTWTWSPPTYLDCTDCPNPVSTPTFNTTYLIKVKDVNNCVSTDTITVKTVCDGENYFIPNTFSPNGDGVNDAFYPRGKGLHDIQSMRIFNRWGQLIFERKNFPANSAPLGWDGTINGKPAPSDAYVYIIEVICINAQVIALKGDVTLIR